MPRCLGQSLADAHGTFSLAEYDISVALPDVNPRDVSGLDLFDERRAKNIAAVVTTGLSSITRAVHPACGRWWKLRANPTTLVI
jgi:hypothetical protein